MAVDRNKKIIIMPRLHDYKGDLKKQWFVFYSVRNPRRGIMQRFRVYDGVSDKKTVKGRRTHAAEIIEKLRIKLLSGWTPFVDDEVIYEDTLAYKKVSEEYGTKRRGNKRFAYYTSLWLGEMNGIRPSTRTSYKSKLRYFIEFLKSKDIQDNDVCEFRPEDARAFVNYLKNDRNLAGKTINEYTLLMKAFFKYLKSENLISVNPYEGIKRVKSETVKPLIFDTEQLKKLVDYSRKNDAQMMLVIKIIFNCFIRPGELRKLKIRDIDFRRGVIRIPGDVAKTKVNRVVDVPTYLLNEIVGMGYKGFDGNNYIIGANGFPAEEMVSRNFLYKRFLKIKKAVGIPKGYVMYALKHTGMVELKLSGADWLEVRNQAGHKSLDQTIEYTTSLMGNVSVNIREKGPKI